MQAFPFFFWLRGQTVVIVGGGEEAAQKARLLSKTDARIVFMAPELTEELQARVANGTAGHVAAVLAPEALRQARLVISCTGCAAADAAVAAVARDLGILVNVVDRPDLCDLTMPAIVDRDPVVVAIGTEGTAPVLAREVKSALETMLEPGLGDLARRAGDLRDEVTYRIAPEERRGFWEWFFARLRGLYRQGMTAQAEAELSRTLQSGTIAEATGKTLTLIDARANQADLMTLRCVQRLQSAALIVHPEGVAPGILELARRDAERSAYALDPMERAAEIHETGSAVAILMTGDGGPKRAAALLEKFRKDGWLAEYVPGVGALPQDGPGSAVVSLAG